VQDAAVLDIGIRSHANFVHIAAEDGVHPDAGVRAKLHVADDLRGFIDIASIADLRGNAFVGADHESLILLEIRLLDALRWRAASGGSQRSQVLFRQPARLEVSARNDVGGLAFS
jgi:hypothetical protein